MLRCASREPSCSATSFTSKTVKSPPNHDGTVLGRPDSARVLGVRTAGDMIRAPASEFWTACDWQMHVVDKAGAIVCRLRLSGTAGAS